MNRGSTLEFRGAMQAGSYETFGTLSAGGDGGTFFKGAIPIVPLARPGSEIGLRNDFGILPATATQGRYGDATPVHLNSSTLRLTGSNAADIREVVGAVSVAGGSSLIPNRSLAGRTTELNLASLTRVGQGQLAISPAVAGQLGSDERVTVAGVNLAAQQHAADRFRHGTAALSGSIVNGMLPAYYISSADSSFVTYGANGFTRVAFTSSQSTPALVNMPGAAYASGVPGEVVPTPEPSTVVSLMTGIAGLLGLHRSRRRR